MRVVGIVQARTGSNRLPGKVLEPIGGQPLLGHMLDRLEQIPSIDQLVVAIPTGDQKLVEYCALRGATCFEGASEDVLDRFFCAAKEYAADVLVRFTSDCPLIDPEIAQQVIAHYLDEHPKYDYVSNTQDRSFPRGMDVEVFGMRTLERAHKEATDSYDREHVTPYIYRRPKEFLVGSFEYRLTVDTSEDLHLMRQLIPELKGARLAEIIHLLQDHPDWVRVNAHIKQKGR